MTFSFAVFCEHCAEQVGSDAVALRGRTRHFGIFHPTCASKAAMVGFYTCAGEGPHDATQARGEIMRTSGLLRLEESERRGQGGTE